jgi:hypothetical protein
MKLDPVTFSKKLVPTACTAVAVAALNTGTGFSSASCADPETVGEATLTADTVTVFAVGTAAGGVYTPPLDIVPNVLLPPATPFTCHVTVVLVRLETAAVNVVVAPTRN